MKNPFHPPARATRPRPSARARSSFVIRHSSLVLCSFLSALTLSASAQVRPTDHAPSPNYDKRVPAAPKAADAALRQQALAHAKTLLDSTSVEFDSLLGTPKFIHSKDGFLTGPAGQGRAVSPQALLALPSNDPDRPIKAFLNEHSALFGHGAEALNSSTKSRDSVTPHNGLRTAVWQQQLDGIPVFESVLIGNLTKNGELVSLSSRFLPDPAQNADAATPNRAALQSAPPVSPADAILKAAADLGETWSASDITSASRSTAGYLAFKTPRSAYVRQVWLPLDSDRLRLCWEVMLDLHQSPQRYTVLVDAQTGDSWLRRCLTEYISDATYNVFTSDSPAPFSPGWPVPNPAQPVAANRVLVTTPAFDTNASPAGWIPDAANTTTGNNADAFLDRDFNGQPDQPRPVGAPARTFDFPQDLTQDPKTYADASTVQMFYWMNYYHDRIYELGFTESAGNYQQDNFGRGGLGNDNIIGFVQAGADLGFNNNAFFSGAPDGFNGQVAMFTFDGCTPNRDGSLDTDVLFHELTHGTSGRLVGGGVGISSLQTAGMGEGWSDFYALSLATEAPDDPDAAYAAGGYATFQFVGITSLANYYFGIRHYPYSTDMTKNPFTFKDIDPTQISAHTGIPFSPVYSPFSAQEANEVHHQGEVWCVTLWDVRANFIHKYGYAGNQLMLQIVTDGMKLSPANPTFLQARDAIILADRVDNGGVDIVELWRGFAKRGMGASAVAPGANSTTGVIEAFDLPGLSVDSFALSGGNGDSSVDPNECDLLSISLLNSSAATATGISARLSTVTPGVLIAGPVSAYPNIPVGATNANLTPFKISTSPQFVCGTPVVLNLVVKSDQETRTNTFTLNSGSLGSPLRFDNNTPVAIPDNNPLGASSVVTVSGLSGALAKATVSLHINHTFDSDLLIQLIAPDGTVGILSANNGRGGDNFGIGCSPDSTRTVFDDDAANAISSGSPPFTGVFQPDQPLTVFKGKFGTNLNGIWQLHVVDQVGIDVGTIQCWSLILSPASCTDGGGQCPGVDLAIGMVAAPEPVFVGSNLVYTISVTNFGPNTAKNTVLSQVLPNNVTFVSATISQGTISQAGGVVTGNIGSLPIGATATATVIVTPIVQGLLSSTASVSSTDTDNDPSNNSVTVLSHVNPPFADLSVGILDAPDPVLVGQTLTYTVSVTNRGPSTASSIVVTNVLPLTVGILSATPSQGSFTISGNVVVFNLGFLTNNSRATATIQVVPSLEGTITATATVSASQVDPVPGNNTASTDTVVGPAADLALGLFANPTSIVPGTNLTYTLRVTNRGPSTATGVVVNDSLPANVTVISTNTSKGSNSVSGTTVTTTIGSLTNGEVVTIAIGVTTTNVSAGTLIDSATVSGNEADPNTANNTASVNVLVSPPRVLFAIDRARINSESLSPTNGTVDPGETVNVSFFIQNNGNIPNTGSGLLVTLLATNGVSSPSGTQNYGNIAPSGVQNRSFTFTASGTNGGTVVATFLLQDPSTNQILTYTFFLPNIQTFANTNRIDIPSTLQDQLQPGPAAPYPSPISVTGVTGLVNKVTVTLSNLNHSFPHDINLLLVGPSGLKTLLLSDAADNSSVSTVDLTFDDAAPFQLPASGEISSGAWQPSAFDSSPPFTAPAPSGPYGAALSDYNAPNPNGTWSLYANDDSAGDFGNIAGGWAVSFTTVIPVNQIADLLVSGASSASTIFAGDTITNTFTITNSGPNSAVNVAFTSVLPPNVTFLSATNSAQNVVALSGSTLSSSLGSLVPGAPAVTVTVVFRSSVAGSLTNTASAFATSGEVDLTLANNSVSQIISALAPSADLAVSAVASPQPVIVGSNLTITVTVTNSGPNSAINTVVSNTLPASVSLLSSNAGPGSITIQGANLVATLGALAPASSATISFVLVPHLAGQITNTARVSTDSADANAANNLSSAITTVLTPSPLILAAGAVLTAEAAPANSSIDAGETVAVALSLTNAGLAGSTNLSALLLPINGVTSPSGSQNYSTLLPGSVAARSFTFTAGSPVGGVILATLQVQDAAGYSNNVVFAFNLPALNSFTNPAAITIPDHGPASPYPCPISVSGLTGVVDKVTVRLNSLTHAFPDDLDIMLVSPSGQKIMLMSDCGGGHSLTNVNLTFDDSAPSGLPDSTQILSGTYKPTDFESGDLFPAPAPAGTISTTFSSLNGVGPNGTWLLYVVDDSNGDAGSISGGWSLTLRTITLVNPAVNLVLTLTDAPDPLLVGSALTYTMTLTNRGPSTATNIVITDVLPPGFSVLSSNSSAGSVNITGGTVNITISSLAPGAGLTASVRTSPSTSGTFVNTATVTSAQADLDPASNTAQTTTTVLIPLRAKLDLTPAANRQFQLTVNADPGQVYRLEGSSNLVSWVPVFTGTAAANGTFKFTTTNATSFNYRFFRSVRIP